jgi:hypothetical protein
VTAALKDLFSECYVGGVSSTRLVLSLLLLQFLDIPQNLGKAEPTLESQSLCNITIPALHPFLDLNVM